MKLRPGTLVRDVNDRGVGVVTAVADSRFAVRVAESHIWLLADALFYVAGHTAKLVCAAEDICRYQAELANPDDSGRGGAAVG